MNFRIVNIHLFTVQTNILFSFFFFFRFSSGRRKWDGSYFLKPIWAVESINRKTNGSKSSTMKWYFDSHIVSYIINEKYQFYDYIPIIYSLTSRLSSLFKISLTFWNDKLIGNFHLLLIPTKLLIPFYSPKHRVLFFIK